MKYLAYITLLTKEYAPLIIGNLVGLGWVVGPANSKNLCSADDSKIGALMAVTVDPMSVMTSTDIVKAIQQVLTELKVSYFSIVLSTYNQGAWVYGNIARDRPTSWERLESETNAVIDTP